MKRWIRFFSFLVAAVMMLTAMLIPAAAVADENAPVDFVLVLDCSASLKQFDRDQLAINACESFVDQMPVQDARVGVIGFGYSATSPYHYSTKYSGKTEELDMSTDATHVHEIMPISALGTSKDREAYKETVVETVDKGYASVKFDDMNDKNLFSPVVPALAAAVDMLEKSGSANDNACIILISDGVSYTRGNSYDHTAVGKQAREHGWPIYCIELNYATPNPKDVETAQKLLDEICTASGDRNVGREYCATPADVFVAFQRIFFDLWKYPEDIPDDWPKKLTLPGEFAFSVPVLTSEATVNIFGSGVTSVTLVDPKGNETSINKDREADDLIAVVKDGKYYNIKMICPTDGEWICKVDGKGNASVLINSTDVQEMGLSIVANSSSGATEKLSKNDTIHVSSYFAYQSHEIHNHSIYEETCANAFLRVRHSNGETREYKMQADTQGYYCDLTLNEFPSGAMTLQVVLEDGMFRNNKKYSNTVRFTTEPRPMELTGNGPEVLTAYVNSEFDKIDLQDIFYNPDGDEVTYGLACADRSVAFEFTEENDYMTIASGIRPGSYQVLLTAKDSDMTTPLPYTLTLNVEDRTPIVEKLPKVELWVEHYRFQKQEKASATVDLSQYFHDPDGMGMTFTQKAENSSIVSVSQDGGFLTLVPGQRGDTVVTVTGFDGVSYVEAEMKVSVVSAKAVFWRDNWVKISIAAALIVLLVLVLIFISKNTRVKGVWTITFVENNGIPVTANNVKISTMNIGRKKLFLLKDLLNALASRLDSDVVASLPKYFGTQKPAAQIQLRGVLFGKGFVVQKIPKDETVRVLYSGVPKQGKVQVRGTVKFILQAPGQLGVMDTMVITFK